MSIKLSELKQLHDKGLALIYLRPKSKRPFEKSWTTQEPKTWDELENSFEKNYNVGVRLGKPSKLKTGKYLAAIDCDVKSKSRAAITEMNEKLRELGIDLKTAPIVMSGRGNGSKHVYVQTDEPMKPMRFAQSERKVKVLMQGEIKPHNKIEMVKLSAEERSQGYRIRPAWEISFMGNGQQTVLPPSIHPDTGCAYDWASPLVPKYTPIFNPRAFVKAENIKRAKHSDGDSGGLDFKPLKVNLYAHKLPTATIDAIVEGLGVEDRSAALLTVCLTMCRAQMTDDQILSVLTDPNHWLAECAYDHTKSNDQFTAARWISNHTLKEARYATHVMRYFDNPPKLKPTTRKEVRKLKKKIENDHQWQWDLQREKNGDYKTSLKNTELILSNVQNQKVFIHDQFSTRDSYGTKTSWGGEVGEALSDIDLVKIRHWISSSAFAIEPPKNITLEAVQFIANRNKTHPVREWLSSLEWDGKSRISTWMRDCLDAKAEEPYLSEVSKMFLLAMVKRVFEPGCQWDYVVVLEGNQGTYKSTTARTLAGDKWFMDNLPDLRDKDAMLNLQGKWVIELGELADVKRGDYNAVKAYLNRRTDTVRSPYGMLQKDIQRQNVFIGTVNEGVYLRDPTGNRRFWPVKVGVCNVEKLKGMREQLFAEAMWVYENCFDGKLMMSPEANAQAKEAQSERRVDDDSTQMEESFLEFLKLNAAKSKKERFDLSKFKAKDLFTKFGGPFQEWESKGWAFNIAAQVLSSNGFERKKLGGQRWWFPRGARVGHHLKRCPTFDEAQDE